MRSGSVTNLDERVAGEAGNIKLTVASATVQGVTGKLSFNLPADPNAASQQLYSINGSTQKHEFTGSIHMRDALQLGQGATHIGLGRDGAILKFGVDNDTTFTHVHNAGVTLNADRSIFFRDAAIGISSQTDGFIEVKADKGIAMTAALTASSNISASGTITAEHIVSSDDIEVGDDLNYTSTTGEINLQQGSTNVFTFSTSQIMPSSKIRTLDGKGISFGTNSDFSIEHGNTVDTLVFKEGSTARLTMGTGGHLTSSANINTTGIYKIQGVNAIDYASSTHLFGANSSFTKLRSTVGIEMTAPITASGDISASGQVYDNTYHQWEASARIDSDDDSNWQAPSGKGILATEDWAQDFAGDYDHPTGSYAASRLTMNTGWYMSTGVNYSASLKSMEIWVQANSNQSYDADTGFTCSLWYSNASDVAGEYNQFGSNAGTFVQRHAAQVDSGQFKNHTSDELFKYNTYLVTQSIDIDLAPGSWIFPRFKTFGSSNFVANVYWTVNYCKKPL